MINIAELFKDLTVTDNAKQAQRETVKYLTKLGFNCIMEYQVDDRGNGWNGYIDIVAIKDNIKLAIEFDRHSPRKKSIYKLNQLDKSYQKIVLLRGYGNGSSDGIIVMLVKIKGGE
jgi:hypothetical protein